VVGSSNLDLTGNPDSAGGRTELGQRRE